MPAGLAFTRILRFYESQTQVLLAASFARQSRRAIEILRCVQYLALRTEPADAKKRAGTAWEKLLAPGEQRIEKGARKR